MIRLNAFAQVGADKKSEYTKLAKELVKQSLHDKGCIAYDLFESGTRGDIVMICETWEDESSLQAHSISAHFTTLVPEMGKIAPLKIEKFIF